MSGGSGVSISFFFLLSHFWIKIATTLESHFEATKKKINKFYPFNIHIKIKREGNRDSERVRERETKKNEVTKFYNTN